MHSEEEIPQLGITLKLLGLETENIYINPVPRLWDQRWGTGKLGKDKLNVRAQTKTLKLAEKSYCGREQNVTR